MFTRVIKRSRSMRVGPGHAGDDVAAHGPAHPSSPSGGPALVSDPPGPTLHDASWLAVQNAAHSPDQFSDGRNLYLDRPLPPPPPPKNAAPVSFAMPSRPSTSGGPSVKASAFLGLSTRSTADKRLSKDDMYLTGHTVQRKGLQPYRVGVRGGLPTPESSPDTDMYHPALSPPMVMPARMHTPESLSSGEIQIGMALGSPSHPPESMSSWQPQLPQGRQPLSPPDLYQDAAAPVVQRQKTQRRRLFGGLFGSRKKEEQPKPSPELVVSNSTTPSVAITPATSQAFAASTPTRSQTVVDRKTPRYKPIMIRSTTLPDMESPVYEPRGGRSETSQGSLLTVPQEPDYSQGNYLPPTSPAQLASASGSGPLLDIEIPSITMERYSVMFSNVLNPQSTSSSLLARRQATLEKLKTINDRILREEEERERLRQRRATSPQPAKSPGFTLFPATPTRQHGSSPLTPRRLGRSNTSPALLPSPSRPSFDLQGPHHHRKERKTVTIISPRSMEHRAAAAAAYTGPPSAVSRVGNQAAEQRTVPTAAEAEGFRFGPDVSGLILDSPQSMGSDSEGDDDDDDDGDDYHAAHGRRPLAATIVDAQPLRPTIPEPEWQMLMASPPPTNNTTTVPPPPPSNSSGSSTTTTATRRSPSSSTSSVHTHATTATTTSTRASSVDVDVDESDSALKAAVEISIARQISISRQQRSLLRPLRAEVFGTTATATTTTMTTGGGGGGGFGRARAGSVAAPGGSAKKVAGTLARREGRVVETKTGTPTEISVGSHPAAAHRKSERVVLEGL